MRYPTRLSSIDTDDEPEWMPAGPGERTEILERRCLAAGTQAHLLLLYVAERHPAGGDPAPPWDCALPSVTPEVDRCVASGSPRAEILDLAMKRGADLIVIGNHDRGLEALGCLGSTSDSVVRQASCGVVTVKAASWPPAPARAWSEGALALTGAGR
jgi:Universal stress protein family